MKFLIFNIIYVFLTSSTFAEEPISLREIKFQNIKEELAKIEKPITLSTNDKEFCRFNLATTGQSKDISFSLNIKELNFLHEIDELIIECQDYSKCLDVDTSEVVNNLRIDTFELARYLSVELSQEQSNSLIKSFEELKSQCTNDEAVEINTDLDNNFNPFCDESFTPRDPTCLPMLLY